MNKCNEDLRNAGLSYPRTCLECGLGPCKRRRLPITTSSRIGTPLQAIKFAIFHSLATENFLHGWLGNSIEWNAFAVSKETFEKFCKENPDEPERADGRKVHYGSGRQPLDDIIDAGWGPGFCVGHILKYLRRTKTPERDLEAAKWYYRFVMNNAFHTMGQDGHAWVEALNKLDALLTNEEAAKLEKKET